jgi:gamma-D-glutamyl-L-lysine dipeptidyl-peptidase
MSTSRSAIVHVPVTVLWRSPESPRTIDAPILAGRPDHAGWLAAMDAPDTARAENRFGLLDRIDSQVVEGEPVLVLEQDAEWSRVVAPWQPSSQDERGYPGYVRTAHLRDGAAPSPRVAAEPVDAEALLSAGRTYLGLRYLWGGTSATALDCSGIVHLVCRAHGLAVPRDAGDQQAACEPVALGSERPGDLYFFAYEGKDIHHVGFVTGNGTMLHAPGTGTQIVEEPMSQDRQDTLVAAGRIPGVLPG